MRGDLRPFAVEGGEGLPHLQADLLGLGFEFCFALREDFLALFFFAADFAAAVDGDGELYADVSAAVAVAVRVAAMLRDFVAVVLVADVKAQLWPVFALRGGTVGFAFFDLQAAGLDDGAIGNRLVYPLVFALSVCGSRPVISRSIQTRLSGCCMVGFLGLGDRSGWCVIQCFKRGCRVGDASG